MLETCKQIIELQTLRLQATSSQTLDALDTEHLLNNDTPTRSPAARAPSRLSAASLAAPLAVATPVTSRPQHNGETLVGRLRAGAM